MHTRLSLGGASLLENGSWKEYNIPVNAFVFLSIVFGLMFFGAKLWMIDRVNMLLSIQKFFPIKKNNNPHKLNLQEFKVWSKLWVLMKFQLDHVDECSCVGYAVSNFDLLSELWENTQIQILFKHYSFIVIIICFFSYKLLIRSILHEFNVIYIWRGCCFTVKYFSLCFFDMKLSFFLVVGLGSVEVSDILTYFIVHFSSEKIEWSWIKQSAASQTRFLTN